MRKFKKLKPVYIVIGVIVGIFIGFYLVGSLRDLEFFSSRRVLRDLHRNFPNHEFEMISVHNSEGRRYLFTLGFDGVIPLPRFFSRPFRTYTIRAVNDDFTFVTRSEELSPSLAYARQLWELSQNGWHDEFTEMAAHYIGSLYADSERLSDIRARLWITPEGVFQPQTAFSPVGHFLVENYLEWFQGDISSIEYLLLRFTLLEQSFNSSINISLEILVDYEFDMERELSIIREIFRKFLLPFQNRLYYQSENHVRISLQIDFMRSEDEITVNNFSWIQEFSMLFDRDVTVESVDEYDFSIYFSRWENGVRLDDQRAKMEGEDGEEIIKIGNVVCDCFSCDSKDGGMYNG